MNKKKASLFLILGFVFSIGLIQNSFAEKGKDYDNEILYVNRYGDQVWQWVSHPERIYSNGEWKDYVLTDDVSTIKLETANSGSLIFDKNTCTYSMYDSGYIGQGGVPRVANIGWTVKGKLDSSSTWTNVNAVNSAACSVSVQTTPETVRITGEKSASVGKFQIVLDYVPGKGIKETMRGYNNNISWNSHNIGFVETFDVPQTIKFGNADYNLANYNGTVLGRTWIQNNEAKIVSFSNNMFYDFGIGFNNLDKVRINWTGSKATLSLEYLFGGVIVPYQQWVEIDPSFGWTAGTHKSEKSLAGTCNTWTSASPTVGAVGTDGAVNSCYYDSLEWNTTSIPDTALITDVKTRYDTSAGGGGAITCNAVSLAFQPSTRTDAQVMADIIAGATYVSLGCTTGAVSDTIVDLGTTADSDLQSRLASNWFAYGIIRSPNALAALLYADFDTTELQVQYLTKSPLAVTTLAITPLTSESLTLYWTQPSLGQGALTHYQINYTTPFGSPLTIISNNSGTGTTYDVLGLNNGQNYSFRVGVQTTSGYNGSGNIANITMAFVPANFTIGSLDFDAVNENVFPIRFERTDTNSSYTTLKVIYDKDYHMSCTFDYQFAQTSDTYTNITEHVYSGTENYTDFNFRNPDNDIIHATCFDHATNDTGRYVMSQNTFPLLEQIQNFRNGTYGTHGMIGAIDFITLAIIIFSTVAFSRINEAAAGVINIALLGALSYFGIIELPTLLLGGVAVIILVMVMSTRKD